MSIRKSLLIALVAGIVCTLTAAPVPAQGPQEKVLVFVGAEDLPGYGPLMFRFSPGFKLEMTDADGTVSGKWRLKGNDIELMFYGDTVVYRGTVQGDRLSGRADNGRVTWNWSVQLQEPFLPAPPTPPTDPLPRAICF